jgi:hypothetical protein
MPTVVTAVQEAAAPSPSVTGGLWRAPLGSTAPVDATTALDVAFLSLGYVNDDGVTRKEDRPNTKQYAWGGSLVASLQDHYACTFTFRLLQIIHPDVLKAVHSDGNVTVTPPTATVGTLTKTLLNAQLNVNSMFVVQGFYQLATFRLFIPLGRVTQIGDYKLTHKTLAEYDLTLEAFPDSTGNFVYQYWNDGVHT